ncbi:MAG: hypothetical protein COV10_01070 [Candidatus Vogelbacteria bacterium CG10_big_fil_rev_8_21_14_0_10_51_16]|uniref:Uncharacterized protein n=1 Tax=Candidatus Vogelbacteria bacterium CG10_big_fil_rev_8_21_14_0_10_51_16 TaxID=1975045 RepID=A0A2H0RF92_9BACT|nr:MAG: hypothetical protein COV10_01070 [Candidatus Vogelbacteria bacterium CG10_big_fil_rev_8_21_14_0_10_51_16]
MPLVATLLIGLLAAVGVSSAFPRASEVSSPAQVERRVGLPSPISSSRETPPPSALSRFLRISWDNAPAKQAPEPSSIGTERPTPTPSKDESVPKTFSENKKSFSDSSPTIFKSIFTPLTTPFASIAETDNNKTDLSTEQFFLRARTANEPLTGVNGLGSMQITRANAGVRGSNFGGPTDTYALTETVPGVGTVQEIIAQGGSGLAMSWDQFNALPPEFRLPDSDARVQALFARGLRPGAIGRLNPQAPYVAIPDSSVPPGTRLIVTDDVTGYQEIVIKVDAGPGSWTGKGIDMSPGLEQRMGGGNHTLSYAIVSDQNAPIGPVSGAVIPYDTPVSGSSAGGGFAGGPSFPLPSGGAGAYPADIGAWVDRSAENVCYKHMSSAGRSSQYNKVETCNSGYRWNEDRDRPIPVKDCGKRATGAGGMTENRCEESATFAAGKSPLYACLWLACKAGNNAIWDKETNTCGCDDGKGNTNLALGSSGLGNTADRLPSSRGDGDGGDDLSPDTDKTPPPVVVTGGSTNQERLDNFNREQQAAGNAARVVLKSSSVNIRDLAPASMDRMAAMAAACNCEVVVTAGVPTTHRHTSHLPGGINFDVRSRDPATGAEAPIMNYLRTSAANGIAQVHPSSYGKVYVFNGFEVIHETSNPNASGPHTHVQNNQTRRPYRP